MKFPTKAFAALISSALILTAPGLGSYEALAQSVKEGPGFASVESVGPNLQTPSLSSSENLHVPSSQLRLNPFLPIQQTATIRMSAQAVRSWGIKTRQVVSQFRNRFATPSPIANPDARTSAARALVSVQQRARLMTRNNSSDVAAGSVVYDGKTNITVPNAVLAQGLSGMRTSSVLSQFQQSLNRFRSAPRQSTTILPANFAMHRARSQSTSIPPYWSKAWRSVRRWTAAFTMAAVLVLAACGSSNKPAPPPQQIYAITPAQIANDLKGGTLIALTPTPNYPGQFTASETVTLGDNNHDAVLKVNLSANNVFQATLSGLPGTDYDILLIDPFGTKVAEFNDKVLPGDGADGVINYTTVKAGNYHLIFHNNNAQNVGATTTLNLTVTPVQVITAITSTQITSDIAGAVAISPAPVPNNPRHFFSNYPATIGDPSHDRAYAVTVPANSVFTALLRGVAGVDIDLLLVTPAGVRVAEDNNLALPGIGRDTQVSFTAAAAGTYFLLFHDNNNLNIGAGTNLEVWINPVPQIYPITTSQLFNDVALAPRITPAPVPNNPLHFFSTYDGTLGDNNNDIAYRINVPANYVLSANVPGIPNVDQDLILTDSAGNIVARNTNSTLPGNGLGAGLAYTSLVGGDYILIDHNNNDENIGSPIFLNLGLDPVQQIFPITQGQIDNDIGFALPVNLPPDPNGVPGDLYLASTINLGDPGNDSTYRITAPGNTVLSARVHGVPNTDFHLLIVDDFGTIIQQDDNTALPGDGTDGNVSILLPNPGNYFVIVHNNNDENIGASTILELWSDTMQQIDPVDSGQIMNDISRSQTITPLSNGIPGDYSQAYGIVLDNSGYDNTYAINVTAASVLSARVTGVADTDYDFLLVDPDGNILDENDNTALPGNGADGNVSVSVNPGRYILIVHNNNNGGIGFSTTLQVWVNASVDPVSPTDMSGVLDGSATYDQYSLDVTQNGTLNLDVTGVPFVNFELQLLDAGGVEVASIDSQSPGEGVSLSADVAPGPYTLNVYNLDGGGAGYSYSVTAGMSDTFLPMSKTFQASTVMAKAATTGGMAASRISHKNLVGWRARERSKLKFPGAVQLPSVRQRSISHPRRIPRKR